MKSKGCTHLSPVPDREPEAAGNHNGNHLRTSVDAKRHARRRGSGKEAPVIQEHGDELATLRARLGEMQAVIAAMASDIDAVAARPRPTAEPPALLTMAEAAAYLRISRSHLYTLIEAGEVQRIQLGDRKPFVPRASAEAYLARLMWVTA